MDWRKSFRDWICGDDTKKPVKKKEDPGATLDAVTIIYLTSLYSLLVSVIYGLQYSVRGAILAFLASLLGYAIGGIAGFLFGFPRYTESVVVANADDLKKALAAQPDQGAGKSLPTLRQNTNLERIVDWLTTMIVGATLVNLQDLVKWSADRFRSLTGAIVYSDNLIVQANEVLFATPGALLVLPLTVGGFLNLYLWARRYLPREWRAADRDLQLDQVTKKTEELADTQQALEKTMDQIKRVVYQVDPSKLQRYASALRDIGADASTVEEVARRYKSAKSWSDDPMEGFGPSEAGGFRITAELAKEPGDPVNPYRVSLKIARTDGQSFSGAVAILLHNSYEEPVIVAPVANRVEYSEKFWCSNAFVLGAVVVAREAATENKTTVRLALDLAKLPDLPAGFVEE